MTRISHKTAASGRFPEPWLCIRRFLLVASLCTAAACSVAPVVPENSGGLSAKAENPKQFRNRQILVTLAQTHEKQWAVMTEALRRDYGLQQTGAFPLKSLGIQCLVFTVPANLDLAATIERLRGDARVEHVQLNRAFESLAPVYNDRYAAMQHGAQKIRAAEVHPFSVGQGVRVAVIDTGIDINHPDLRGRIAHAENFVDGGQATFNTDAHGTAVAGVIGARANNKIGIFGVAPSAAILGYKACWYPEKSAARAMCSSWTLVKAIDRAILDRAHIINLSLAGPHDVLLERVIKRAVAANIVVVAAVNDAHRADSGFPASLAQVIAVVSDHNDHPQQLSRFAPHRRVVAAPGKEILTAMPNNRYDFVSGSSLATAHVTGVIALMLAGNTKLTVAEIHELIGSPATQAPVSTHTTSVGMQINACEVFARMQNRRICPDPRTQAVVGK